MFKKLRKWLAVAVLAGVIAVAIGVALPAKPVEAVDTWCYTYWVVTTDCTPCHWDSCHDDYAQVCCTEKKQYEVCCHEYLPGEVYCSQTRIYYNVTCMYVWPCWMP